MGSKIFLELFARQIMPQFLGRNELSVLTFIDEKPRRGRELTQRFAQVCDITHVVAGLKDRGLVSQLRCRHWANHLYRISKDGSRKLKLNQYTPHNNTHNAR